MFNETIVKEFSMVSFVFERLVLIAFAIEERNAYLKFFWVIAHLPGFDFWVLTYTASR